MSLPQRINFCLSIVNNNRGWIPVLLDCLDPAMQRLKNWVEVLFTCPRNDKESHRYAISPSVEHHNRV